MRHEIFSCLSSSTGRRWPLPALAVRDLHVRKHQVARILRHVPEDAGRRQLQVPQGPAQADSGGTEQQTLELHRQVLQAEEAELRGRRFSPDAH